MNWMPSTHTGLCQVLATAATARKLQENQGRSGSGIEGKLEHWEHHLWSRVGQGCWLSGSQHFRGTWLRGWVRRHLLSAWKALTRSEDWESHSNGARVFQPGLTIRASLGWERYTLGPVDCGWKKAGHHRPRNRSRRQGGRIHDDQIEEVNFRFEVN